MALEITEIVSGFRQTSYKSFTRVFAEPQGFGSPHKQLAVTCQTLQKPLTTTDDSFQTKDKAWKTYAKALLLAQRCNHLELIQVIVKFDPLFEEQVPDSSFPAKRILSVLLNGAQTGEL